MLLLGFGRDGPCWGILLLVYMDIFVLAYFQEFVFRYWTLKKSDVPALPVLTSIGRTIR